MGRRLEQTRNRRLQAKVIGTSPIRRIEVVKNGKTVYTKRPMEVGLGSTSRLVVGFESSSEPLIRDNPRGYRQWQGSLQVEGAKLAFMNPLHFDNKHKEWARMDGAESNTIRFSTGTRGQADTLMLHLEGATPSTTISIDLEPASEWGKSPVPVRPSGDLPDRKLEIALHQLSNGQLRKDVSEALDMDAITLELVSQDMPMGAEIDFTDMGTLNHGDYYYVRVNQLDGARAFS